MIHYWCDDEITKKDFITTCATQFKTEFSQLFGDIFARSYCSVIRTSILEVALALTSAGLPLNGFNFDKVGLKAASAEAAAVHDGENLVKTSEWNLIQARVWRWQILSNHCITKCKHCHLTSFWVSWKSDCLMRNRTVLTSFSPSCSRGRQRLWWRHNNSLSSL